MWQTNTGDIFKVVGKGVGFVGEKVGRVLMTQCVGTGALLLKDIFYRERQISSIAGLAFNRVPCKFL